MVIKYKHISNSIFLLSMICLSAISLDAQKVVQVNDVNGVIDIDGVLDESVWDISAVADSFYQYFPIDTIQTGSQSEMRFLMDDKHLYIGIKCNAEGGDYTIPSLKRDYRAGGNDNITILIDPNGDGNNAYFFGLNPLGVKREGIITRGGTTNAGFSTSWDQKWYGDAQRNEGSWSAEMKIPFNIIQFNPDSSTWKINAYRFDMQSYERSTWHPIPNTQTIFNLTFMGDLEFEKPLKKSNLNLTFIPYVTGGAFLDKENGASDYEPFYDLGGDVKMNVTSNLKLDLTINPDFSQVEVDQQITNLDRFELFFPERRLFFLENADLFSNFGFRETNPFFSRRIGLSFDDVNGYYVKKRILGGARLSGSLNDRWRIGVMNMQTDNEGNEFLEASNFGVVTLQRRIGLRSNISFIGANKYLTSIQNAGDRRLNTVIGADFNFANEDNTWFGKLFFHSNINNAISEFPFATGLTVERIKKSFSARWKHTYIGEGYDAEIGFVRRQGVFSFQPEFRYYIHNSESYIFRQGPTLNIDAYYKPNEFISDYIIDLGYQALSKYNYSFSANWIREFILLTSDFDPTGTDAIKLTEGSIFNFNYFTAEIRTDRSRTFWGRFRPVVGYYYNGFRLGASGNFNYRFQPYGSLALNYNYNYFDLPHTSKRIHTLLIGPRLDVSFTKSFFLSSFLQYNTQIENTNLNIRLQWRYAPVSDVYLVFTDNYFSDPSDPSSRFIGNLKNRAILLKANYWLGL